MINMYFMLAGTELSMFRAYMRFSKLQFSQQKHRSVACAQLFFFMDLVQMKTAAKRPLGILTEGGPVPIEFPIMLQTNPLINDSRQPFIRVFPGNDTLLERAEKIRTLIGDESSDVRDLSSIVTHGLQTIIALKLLQEQGIKAGFISDAQNITELLVFPE